MAVSAPHQSGAFLLLLTPISVTPPPVARNTCRMKPAANPRPEPVAGKSRTIRLIVVHCSATPNDRTLFTGKYGTPGFRDPSQEIDAWHAARGFRRDSYWRGLQNPRLQAIGYHYVIARNGALFTGRHVDEAGAHAEGWNAPSLGICLVGTDRFTPQQWLQLKEVVTLMAQKYGIPLAPPVFAGDKDDTRYLRVTGVCGHRDLPGAGKSCPGFNVRDWLAKGMSAME